MNGILIIDKPKGFTSFDVIAKLRKKLGQKKIGHMGTLDPMATGVLPILLGDTAKFQIFVNDNDKSYVAKIRFGVRTDTLDITGKTMSEQKSNVTGSELEDTLKNFVGEIFQVPPMFSAIKQNGVKLCNLARKGVEVEREKRKITIHSIELLNFDFKNQEAVISVHCSKGTYIRSLCDDIGNALGSGAVLCDLRRTLSNGFSIESSVSLDKVIESPLDKVVDDYILPTEKLFENLKSVEISPAQAVRFKNGGALMLSRVRFHDNINDKERYKVYSEKNFIGIGQADSESAELKILKCLK